MPPDGAMRAVRVEPEIPGASMKLDMITSFASGTKLQSSAPRA